MNLGTFAEGIVNFLPKIPVLIIDFLIGYVLIKILIWSLEYFLRIAKLPKLKGVMVSFTKTALWIVFAIFIANQFGFNRLAVAISGSVLVLAFLLNNGVGPLVSDIVSGIFLCGDSDFKTGSKVKIGKGEDGCSGEIVEVDMRKVRLRDEKGIIHVVPNSVVDRDQWTVLEKPERKRPRAAEVIKSKLKRS